LGPVFRAYDAAGEHLVAVKLFKLDLPPERGHQLVAEFERLIAADLTHPALASPLATGIHDVAPYLVQEYVAAESLDLAVREWGPAPVADAVRVAAQLAGGLDFAAAVNIAHGSLHPRDVLLSSDETQLTGIGVARALEKVGVTIPVRRPYTPPERLAGGVWDRRADVFSLAALMHELIWARRVTGLGKAAVESLGEVPGADLAALREAFARALAEDPAKRYDTALEFAQALKDACPEVAAAVARPPAPKRRTTRPAAAPSLPLLDGPARRAGEPLPDDQPSHDGTVTLKGDQTLRIDPDPTADPDLTLITAEEERYRDAESAPAIVATETMLLSAADVDEDPSTIRQAPPADRSAPRLDPLMISPPAPETFTREPAFLSVVDRSGSSIWPLALALVVGLTIGFAGGYGTGMRERPAQVASAVPASPTPPGREFTESAVAETPKAASPARKPAAPVAAAAPAPQSAIRGPESAIRNPESAIREPQSEIEKGRLLVRSTPAGARVFVDGKEKGLTPAVVRGLTQGAHRIRVMRDGFASEDRRIVITSARPSQSMTIPLERASNAASARNASLVPASGSRFIGGLTVVSRPPGASVFLDGKNLGTTPLSVPGIAAGSHAIRLEYDGYHRWTSAIRVVANEQNRVTASLEK
jgi:hypothetical protein